MKKKKPKLVIAPANNSIVELTKRDLDKVEGAGKPTIPKVIEGRND